MSLSHSHDHNPASYGQAFAIGIALNIGFVIIEAFYGWHSQSCVAACLRHLRMMCPDIMSTGLMGAEQGKAR